MALGDVVPLCITHDVASLQREASRAEVVLELFLGRLPGETTDENLYPEGEKKRMDR
jgi:hypothetical protein